MVFGMFCSYRFVLYVAAGVVRPNAILVSFVEAAFLFLGVPHFATVPYRHRDFLRAMLFEIVA